MQDTDAGEGLSVDPAPAGPFPKPLLDTSLLAGGLRYVPVGEDGEFIVFFGHPPLDDLIAAAGVLADRTEVEPDLVPESADDFEVTMAWLWTSCPIHTTRDEECQACHATEEDWRLNWHPTWPVTVSLDSCELTLQARPDHRPPPPPVEQQFPVTVWSLD